MITQEKIKRLVDIIKSKTGKSQEEVSVAAGYKRKTLTQRISSGKDLDAIYKRLEISFKAELNNSTYQNKKNQPQEEVDLQTLVHEILDKMEGLQTNSNETNWLAKVLLTGQIGYGRAIGNSLDELRKVPEGTTTAAADTIDQQIWKMLEQKGIAAIVRR